MRNYQLFQKYGLTVILSFASLLLLIALISYQSTTYVRLETVNKGEWRKMELDAYKDSLENDRAARQKARLDAEKKRKESMIARGIKISLSDEKKAKNEKIEKKNEEIEKAEIDYAVESTEKVGNISFLLSNMYIFVILAVVIALAFPLVKIGIDVIIHKHYKNVMILGIGAAVVLLIFFIGQASSGHLEDYLDKATISEQERSGGLLITTIVLLVLALISIVGGEIYKVVKQLKK